MVRLVFEALRRDALLGDVEHRSLDPNLGGRIDLHHPEVLEHPGDVPILFAKGNFDVGERTEIAKSRGDRGEIRCVLILETYAHQLVAR